MSSLMSLYSSSSFSISSFSMFVMRKHRVGGASSRSGACGGGWSPPIAVRHTHTRARHNVSFL